jgi:hypothetical protein
MPQPLTTSVERDHINMDCIDFFIIKAIVNKLRQAYSQVRHISKKVAAAQFGLSFERKLQIFALCSGLKEYKLKF